MTRHVEILARRAARSINSKDMSSATPSPEAPLIRNLPGALIFWLYIILALVFTYFVLDSILRLPPPRPSQRRNVISFSMLAVFSFAALSFNMLHVLIYSFKLWLIDHPLLETLTVRSAISVIWKWSTTSTLFKDFGVAIVADLERFLWTQLALGTTFSICLYMGGEGVRRSVPRLWAYFSLSQILPISFAQNLFYIALLKLPPADEGTRIKLPQRLTAMGIIAYWSCLVAVMPAPIWKILYRVLAAVPLKTEAWIGPDMSGAINPQYLIPTILVARALLLLPFFLPKAKQQQNDIPSPTRLSDVEFAQSLLAKLGNVMNWGLLFLLFDLQHTWFGWPSIQHDGVFSALWSHPAVTSLGFDFLVSALSVHLWGSKYVNSGNDPGPQVKDK